MKKIALGAGFFLIILSLFPQELQHQVTVVNIEIIVRVLKSDTFVDNLTINDFEIFEDGKLQQIEAVYLVKKTNIKREEGKKGNAPQVARPQLNRQFVLFFEMSDYLSEVDKALDNFFDNVILPGDSLIVITPVKTYHLRSDSLDKMSKVTVKEQLRAKLRRDIITGSSEYRNTIDEMYRTLATMQAGSKDVELMIDDYTMFLSRLESLRRVDEKGLLDFANFLKGMPGQKYIYMFYQMERIPQYNPKNLMTKMLENQDNINLLFKLTEVFESFHRDIGFNVEAVKKAYADSGITIHFLFVTKTPAVQIPIEYYADKPLELAMVEKSEDIYNAFSEVAKATGGISDTSANAAAAFQRAVSASENYYLIYYKPRDYKADGKFHELKVNVKSGNYRVTNRAGYIAR